MPSSLLELPVWSSLTTDHSAVAVGGDLAKRYPADVLPFVAYREDSPQALEALEAIVLPGEIMVMPGQNGPVPNWNLVKQFEVFQFILDEPVVLDHSIGLKLGPEAVPSMVGLTQLVYPAYFREATATLGDYIGVWQGEQLIAMAGVRFSFPGYKEISAVCVHPDHRGKGLAKQLVKEVAKLIQDQGLVPFLHTETDNPAQKLYADVGFRVFAQRPVWVCQRS